MKGEKPGPAGPGASHPLGPGGTPGAGFSRLDAGGVPVGLETRMRGVGPPPIGKLPREGQKPAGPRPLAGLAGTARARPGEAGARPIKLGHKVI